MRAITVGKASFSLESMEESEIVKAYINQILDLPLIPDVNVEKVHEFSEKLSYCV